MFSTIQTVRKTLTALGFAAIAFTSAITSAAALDITNVAFVQVSDKATSIPVGHSEFCASRPKECQPNKTVIGAVSLTEARWNEMVAVNAYMNATIVATSDQELYQTAEFWTYPNGYGDCEDIALAKRRALIEAGWPASVLLMSVVRQANGEGHAVLLVRTDRGDMVLDNLVGDVSVWNQTPYTYLKRQSQQNAGVWVDMFDTRTILVAATR